MRLLIVDDEESSRQDLLLLLSRHPEVKVVGQASDVDSAFDLTRRLKPDAVFLDIKLAGETGFDYVARLGEHPPRLVFVTAFDHYAVRGFECNALDYLLKPVPPERLAETLRRLGLQEPAPPRAKADDVLFLKAPAVARFVPWREVHHIVSEGNYTRVHLEDGSVVVIYRTLKKWLELIPEGLLIQVHRTALVRHDVLRELQAAGGKQKLVLSDGSIVPISRDYAVTLKR